MSPIRTRKGRQLRIQTGCNASLPDPDLTTKRLRRSVFLSVPELVAALEKYLANHTEAPTPFVWTAEAKDIMKVKRAQKKLSRRHPAH
jgi:hypothetical protein